MTLPSDCNEENNTLIAVTERELEAAIHRGLNNVKMRYTHLEIDPFTILGVVGGVIPVRLRHWLVVAQKSARMAHNPIPFDDIVSPSQSGTA